MSMYYCPICGSDLETQKDYSPSLWNWTCTKCGELIIQDDGTEDSFGFDDGDNDY